MSQYTMLYEYGKPYAWLFLGQIYFHFGIVFLFLFLRGGGGAFLVKQLLHLHLLDVRL